MAVIILENTCERVFDAIFLYNVEKLEKYYIDFCTLESIITNKCRSKIFP